VSSLHDGILNSGILLICPHLVNLFHPHPPSSHLMSTASFQLLRLINLHGYHPGWNLPHSYLNYCFFF
jgi:hypothetical protein